MQVTLTPLQSMSGIKSKSRAVQMATEKAIVSSLNKMAAQGMTQGRKAITDKYNIKAKDVKNAITIKRASKGRHEAIIKARGDSSLPLFLFGGSPKQPKSQVGIKAPYKRRTRASAKVLKAGKREKLKHAFVAKMPSGNVGIFERVGKKSLPLREKTTIGIPKMFKFEAVKAIDRVVETKGEQIFKHELGYYLDKIGVREGAL